MLASPSRSMKSRWSERSLMPPYNDGFFIPRRRVWISLHYFGAATA
jgi:hypothetical protein